MRVIYLKRMFPHKRIPEMNENDVRLFLIVDYCKHRCNQSMFIYVFYINEKFTIRE